MFICTLNRNDGSKPTKKILNKQLQKKKIKKKNLFHIHSSAIYRRKCN